MTISIPQQPTEIIAQIISAKEYFPNNAQLPLLIYRNVFAPNQRGYEGIKKLLAENKWGNTWLDSIYDYHHYHSNTHEVLIIIAGQCEVIYGGPQGEIFILHEGDVVFHPAGVSHQKVKATPNFACIGAYPESKSYDMFYGKKEEHPRVDENIQKVKVPKTDAIFGAHGILFQYWQEKYLPRSSDLNILFC